MDLYESRFAGRLAKTTQEYYRAEAERLASQMSSADYLTHTDSRLKQEAERCKRYSFNSNDVMNGVHELIAKIYKDLLSSGFKELVDKNDVDSLRTLHRFMIITEHKESTTKCWGEYIKVYSSLI